MRCVLPAVNVKLFAKATHCLAKLGSEIYFEPLENGLALKTVNSSRSAYACFLFMRPLFQVYEHSSGDIDVDDVEEFKCKVAVKTMLQVFKSLSTIERSVESCDINLDSEACRLVFQLKCRHGIVKTHQLTFQECESLQAVFAKDLSPNVLKCEHKLMNDVVVNFSPSFEEITLSVTPCQVILRSYTDADNEPNFAMKTEMSLNPEEFTDFQVGVDTDITFSLKDLRAILAFCDIACVPMHMHFEVGGRPLVVSVEHEGYFRANFVLATISDDDLTSQGKEMNSAKANLTSNATNRTKTGNSTASFAAARKQANTKQTRQSRSNVKLPTRQQKNVSTRNADNNSFSKLTEKIKPDNSRKSLNLDDELSPEIPLQDHNAGLLSNNNNDFKNMKKVFFEPTQINDDHTLVVLAPDSDDDEA